MKAIKGIVVLALVTIIVTGIILRRHSPGPPSDSTSPAAAEQPAASVDSFATPDAQPANPPSAKPILSESAPENIYPSPDKVERLRQIRERFRGLAAGDPIMAMRAAKRIPDEVEREAALLTLVTEWRHGELNSPRIRAHRIDAYGLEAGLGFELISQPELALAWANELADGQGRMDLLQTVARGMVISNPAAAFALTEQAPEAERRKFFDTLLSDWTLRDTAAALQWAEQIPNPTDRDAALQTIRTVAPSGIGAAMTVQDGHPVFNDLIPGTPAAQSGQIAPGDRLLAVAQGNNMFVDVQNLPLPTVIQLIRGAPGTPIQLQILPTNAPPNSPPRLVYLYRDQIKFKN